MNTQILDDKKIDEAKPMASFAQCETEPSINEEISEDSTRRLANIVLDHRCESTREEIQGAVAFSSALTRLKGNSEATKFFFEKLRLGNYLTKAEAEVGISEQSESTVSKIRKIEAFSDILFKKEVYRFLRPGIELLYETAQLVEATGLTGTDAVAKVSAILASSDGPIKRPWLKKERNKLSPKPPREKDEAKKTESSVSFSSSKQKNVDELLASPSSTAKGSANDMQELRSNVDVDFPVERTAVVAGTRALDSCSNAFDQNVTIKSGESRDTSTPQNANVIREVDGPKHQAIVLTINEADAERLSLRATENLACFSAANNMASDAVLFAFTTARALLALTPIVGRFKFKRCVAVILLKSEGAGEITDHPVLALFERGASLTKPHVGIDFSRHPTAIAEKLLKDGLEGPRLHLFAETYTDGWDTVLIKNAWSIS